LCVTEYKYISLQSSVGANVYEFSVILCREAPKEKRIIPFSMEKEMKITN